MRIFINSFQTVTHNYLRESRPNVWFTIVGPDQGAVDSDLAQIEGRIGTKVKRLPVTRLFKIGVKLDI